MDTQVAITPYRRIAEAHNILAALSPRDAQSLLAAASDVVVVLDADLVVQDVGFRDASLGEFGLENWIGRSFTECVTAESVEKAQALLGEAASRTSQTARQLNHPGQAASSGDLAVVYRAVSVGDPSRYVLLGDDLRPVTSMQDRLVRTQLDLDRDVRRLREIETRYRLLFKLADAPLMIVDADTLSIVDANDPAGELFGRATRKLTGLSLQALFPRGEQAAVAASVSRIAARGDAGTVSASLGKDGEDVTLRVEPYREVGGNQLLVRAGAGTDGAERAAADDNGLLRVIESMPDGLIVIDRAGYIVDANDAALDFVRVPSRDRLIGRKADTWIGGTSVDMQVLTSTLRDQGSVRQFATVVRDEMGGHIPVELSATHATVDGETAYGFVLRESPQREAEAEADPRYAASQFTDLVGRVSLRELVRDTADIIEKLCIDEALRQTDNNRASAADMLGLSRQSLYMKLKRYGLEDGPSED